MPVIPRNPRVAAPPAQPLPTEIPEWLALLLQKAPPGGGLLDQRPALAPLIGPAPTLIGDVVKGPKRWFTGETPVEPLLGPMGGGGGPRGGGGVVRPDSLSKLMKPGMPGYNPKTDRPSAKDTAQTSFSLRGYAKALEEGGPKAASQYFKNAPTTAKERAEIASIKQQEQAFRNKWSAWAKKVGRDPNEVVKRVEILQAGNMMHGRGKPPDDWIKYQLTLPQPKE